MHRFLVDAKTTWVFFELDACAGRRQFCELLCVGCERLSTAGLDFEHTPLGGSGHARWDSARRKAD